MHRTLSQFGSGWLFRRLPFIRPDWRESFAITLVCFNVKGRVSNNDRAFYLALCQALPSLLVLDIYPWSAYPLNNGNLVCRVGIEPTTLGLRDPCSTAELSAHYLEDTQMVSSHIHLRTGATGGTHTSSVYHQSNGGSPTPGSSGECSTIELPRHIGCPNRTRTCLHLS